jgi:hypothetical protein
LVDRHYAVRLRRPARDRAAAQPFSAVAAAQPVAAAAQSVNLPGDGILLMAARRTLARALHRL